MDGAEPATVDFVTVAYVIAMCAVAAAAIGMIQLWRRGGLWLAFVVLLAPWLMVLADTRIIPVYMNFAFDPEAWGNPVLPVWATPLVGGLLIVAGLIRAASRGERN
jgi:hypothetical protein